MKLDLLQSSKEAKSPKQAWKLRILPPFGGFNWAKFERIRLSVTIKHFCNESPNPINASKMPVAQILVRLSAYLVYGVYPRPDIGTRVSKDRAVFIFALQSTEQLPPLRIFDYSGLKGKM